MLTLHQLERRIALSIVQLGRLDALPYRPTTATITRLEQARQALADTQQRHAIRSAWRQLNDNAPGYPATSMPGPGAKNSHSDRTGTLATETKNPDPVGSVISRLDQRTANLAAQTLAIYVNGPDQAGRYSKQICDDAHDVRFIILEWSRRPQTRFCTSCERDKGYKQVITTGGRHASNGLCPWCGDYKKVNGIEPPADVLHYHHLGPGRIPERVLAKHRHRLPKGRR